MAQVLALRSSAPGEDEQGGAQVENSPKEHRTSQVARVSWSQVSLQADTEAVDADASTFGGCSTAGVFGNSVSCSDASFDFRCASMVDVLDESFS